MIVDNYSKAYKEVLEILKYVQSSEVEKIPKEFINMMEKNKDDEYEYHVNESKPFSEQKVLRETRAILAIIYKEYWTTPERRDIINEKFKNDIKRLTQM